MSEYAVYQIKDQIFSKDYRDVVRKMKKMMRDDDREERKLDDFRTSEGEGRKGPAAMSAGIPKSRHRRRNSGTKSRPIDWQKEEDSNAGPASTPISEV